MCNQRKMYLLRSDVKSGRRNEAWISYNSSTHNLSVAFSGLRNNSVVMQGLDYQVDLRQHLPEFVTFGFSMATGVDFAIFSIYSWEFNSSLEMDDETTNPVFNPKSRRKNITALVVGLCLGGGFLVGGVVLIIWLAGIGRKRKEGDEEDNQGFSEYIDDEFERGAGPKRFPYKELALATNDFNDDQKLGQGGFGGVYKGFFRETNSYIAVKRVSQGSKQGIKEYASEVKIISRLRHKNLVQLLGWCHEKNELLLVYEVMANGSCRWKMAHDLSGECISFYQLIQYFLSLLPMVNCCCQFASDGEEQGFDRGIQEPVHILAYYSSYGPSKYEELENLLGNIRDGRFLRAKDMILKLNKLKLPLKWENVAKIAGKGVAPGRLHVARAMVEAGHVENLKQAFARYLYDGGPAYST